MLNWQIMFRFYTDFVFWFPHPQWENIARHPISEGNVIKEVHSSLIHGYGG